MEAFYKWSISTVVEKNIHGLTSISTLVGGIKSKREFDTTKSLL